LKLNDYNKTELTTTKPPYRWIRKIDS